eukprot:gnl/Hemi2/27860_TR9200_c0_g1_i1.p1 gnl/Hemi2/27860_TR9200_c0_g1~~gnl/Hemi2/27860_TR9200_c0_g1_i1.p1  ORF type:complete len:528 (+),score=204.33 gnl/Hemi2/27860_TR9200_c0_g1_i1:108-1691(+)
MASNAGANAKWQSKDDWKAAKELEEARKAGTAPPEQDEEGNDINPHIPHYISQAPWYLQNNKPGLKHQRLNQFDQFTQKFDNDWYQRGKKKAPAATTFRKGACTNCGSMTHQAKDCCERPRKLGAKHTGENIQADDPTLPNFKFDFDGTHDRWNGYDPNMYKEVYENYARQEELRRKAKAEQLQSTLTTEQPPGDAAAGATPAVEDDEKDEENQNKWTKMDAKTRITVRNLRIREDTPKYLLNLDLKSAYYDPKTRSMRADPTPDLDKADRTFTGDNAIRLSGDVAKQLDIEKFAWDAFEAGKDDIHVLANPSQSERAYKEHLKQKAITQNESKSDLLAKYEARKHVATLPPELIFAQTEQYVEYSRDGKIIKGDEKRIPSSKYEEDVYHNNHTAIWGSFYDLDTHRWGYQCCHQLTKNSYCTGQAGKQALKASRMFSSGQTALQHPVAMEQDPVEVEKEKAAKLKAALEAEEKYQKSVVELDDRKRAYNSLSKDSYEVTEEQVEAYRQKRPRFDDPMANYKDEDDL